jgi:hypothetical protein
MAGLAVASVLLVGIRVHALSLGSAPDAVGSSVHQHLERQNLRQFAAAYLHPNRPFTIALVFSEAPRVPEPVEPFICVHRGGFYVNRPPPLFLS